MSGHARKPEALGSFVELVGCILAWFVANARVRLE